MIDEDSKKFLSLADPLNLSPEDKEIFLNFVLKIDDKDIDKTL